MADNIYIRDLTTGKAAPAAREAAFRQDNPKGRFVYFDPATGAVVPSPGSAASAVNQVDPAPSSPAPSAPAPEPVETEVSDDTVAMSQAEIDEIVHGGPQNPAPDRRPAPEPERTKKRGWLG